MNLDLATGLAHRLLASHSLPGWSVRYYWSYDDAGCCLRPKRWIALSAPFIEANEEKEVREIVLHEIAHALTDGTGEEAHNEEWRRVFVAIGGSGLTQPPLRRPSAPPSDRAAAGYEDPRSREERKGLRVGRVDG